MIQGYCTPMVVSPGDRIEFKVSASTAYERTFVRLKTEGVSVGLPLSAPETESEGNQEPPDKAWENGCAWLTSFHLDVPLNWRSGMYAAMCTEAGGETFYIVFVVRPDSAVHAEVAALANTITWNAYEGWPGQKSKYDGYPSLSFERPFPSTSPIKNPYVNHVTRAELWVLNWLEDTGYDVDVYSDTDFHNGIQGLAQYRVLILNTHPEYFTTQMMDNLQAAGDPRADILECQSLKCIF
jgi:N,N-dimethylformamidase